MHKAPGRVGFCTKSAAALNDVELRIAIATNCCVLAILLFEIGLGFLSPSTGWFLLPAALAGVAIWLGSRGLQVVAGMLLATSLLIGAVSLSHNLREPQRQHPTERLWTR